LGIAWLLCSDVIFILIALINPTVDQGFFDGD